MKDKIGLGTPVLAPEDNLHHRAPMIMPSGKDDLIAMKASSIPATKEEDGLESMAPKSQFAPTA